MTKKNKKKKEEAHKTYTVEDLIAKYNTGPDKARRNKNDKGMGRRTR